MSQPPVTGLHFTRKQRAEILAGNKVRLTMIEVMREITATVNDPDVNSTKIPNPRLNHGRAIGRRKASQ